MNIERIDLQNFRTYSYTNLTFSPNLNILLGQNAVGKTTILEAISMFSYGRSVRAKQEKELIQFGQEQSQLRILFNQRGKHVDMAMKILQKGKQIKVNGVPKKNLSEFLGQLHVIVFSPDDLYMIKLGPEERRKFLNLNMGQFINGFVDQLRRYNQLLLQRNSLLRMRQLGPLSVWDEQLSEAGAVVLYARKLFVEIIAKRTTDIYEQLSSQRECLQMTYKTSTKGATEAEYRESLYRQLQQTATSDIEKGYTTVGPHRDDLTFHIDDRVAARFASQGQIRTIILAVKFALFDYIVEKTQELPVILLDDVFSELDVLRQEHLLTRLQGAQTILTTTYWGNKKELGIPVKVFNIAHGILSVEE